MRITGDNGTSVEVNAENQLVVRAINEPEIEHASSMGNSYAWTSGVVDTGADGTHLYLRNNGSVPLILDRLVIAADDSAISLWTINLGTATTTPSGTPVVGVNLNTAFSSDLADATGISIETAVATGSPILTIWAPFDTNEYVDLSGVVLAKNHYIQINQTTDNDTGIATIFGHFEVIS